MNAPEYWISRLNQILKSKVRKQTQLRPILRRWACLIMRSSGGNRTVSRPVMRQWESCHIVKDTPWADGGIGLSFRTIRWIFGVEWGIFRLIVWVRPKQNHVLFDRLITDARHKWSSFNVHEKAGTLSPYPVFRTEWREISWVIFCSTIFKSTFFAFFGPTKLARTTKLRPRGWGGKLPLLPVNNTQNHWPPHGHVGVWSAGVENTI